jgi:pyruvate,water dikinase
MTYALCLNDPLATDVSLVGGKAASLATLMKAGLASGFNVPAGWAISSLAHDLVLKPVKARIRRLEAVPSDDHEALEKSYAAMIRTLNRVPLDRLVLEALGGLLDEMRGPCAVRSSATCEDSAGAAFAGQHETFLNVSGEANIIRAIKLCFASFYAPQALIYRRQAGVTDAKMAVVVQKMAPCDKAGVAFSLNPVTGALNETVINANFGLGESVVSGETDIDQFVYDRDQGQITERHVAQDRLVMTASGSAQMVTSKETGPSIDDYEIAQIAELSAKVTDYMGYPQDIEWGYVADNLVLLQSRPITRLPERLTRDESAERFPNAVTPMTWGLVEAGFHRSLAASFDLMGLPPLDGKWFVEKDNYIYGNQTAVELYHGLAAASNSAFDFTPKGLSELALKLARIDRFAKDWQVNLERYIGEMAALGQVDLEGTTLEERWAHVEAVNESCARFFEPNIAISLFHTGLSKALEGAASLLVGELDGPVLVNDLKAGIDTRTAYVNREMRKLADLVRMDNKLLVVLKALDAFDGSAEDLIASGAFAGNPGFEQAFAAFVRDFGHREVDFDPWHAPWGDDPAVLLAQIMALAEADCGFLSDEDVVADHADGRAKAFAARQKLLNEAPDEAALALNELIDLVCLFEELDDLEHYATSRITRPIRRALLAAGESLVAAGVLSAPRDIWMVAPDTIRAALASDDAAGWLRVTHQVLEGAMAYKAATSTSPEWNYGHREIEIESGDSLVGLPGSAGQVEGEVFVLESAADFKRFPKGAVLVARTTNPAWTPLFYAASAVITESGGPLSHGAVTAREVGIPAVMCVKSAITKLTNGLRVRVDGTTGRIELLEPA